MDALKKVFLPLNILIILLLFTSRIEAQSIYEVQLKTIRKIDKENLERQYPIILDYSVALLNQNTDSADIYYVVKALIGLIPKKNTEQTQLIFKYLKDKYPLPISDYENDLGEKLIYSILLFHTADQDNSPQLEQETAAEEILKNIIDKSSEKNYVMAALLLMTRLDYENYQQYFNTLKEKFPTHKAWPYLEWNNAIVRYGYVEKDQNKYIVETLKLAEKYKNLITPFGEKYYIECYSSVAFEYAISFGNYKKAEEYLAIIERDSPNYIALDWLRKIVRPKAK